MFDSGSVRESKSPSWVRAGLTHLDMRCAVGVNNTGVISIRAQRGFSGRCFQQHLRTVDQHHASAGRARRRQQQRMVAARADCAYGAEVKPPSPSGSSHSVQSSEDGDINLIPYFHSKLACPCRHWDGYLLTTLMAFISGSMEMSILPLNG